MDGEGGDTKIRRRALRAAYVVTICGALMGCGTVHGRGDAQVRPDDAEVIDRDAEIAIADGGRLDAGQLHDSGRDSGSDGGRDAGLLCSIGEPDWEACCDQIGWDWERGCTAWGPFVPPGVVA